ncbi:rhodanese-like domain-containing protein [Beggiatoa leptomitoformis]|uniref:Sulfurtransferase n=1 Tax=Beggiatoa leptomitoformis TaxID=288004 RepID=A0A2N9YHL0_9GAMM|nr:rhodanese-like domain-containing protein [Beggiatoa leptomitoformis]ALG68009.1 sulfurtransferase [Beggiatoa leptomitoformis]AUI69706.1 sulfurtransferase [Beggiatoa leptomitoformis]
MRQLSPPQLKAYLEQQVIENSPLPLLLDVREPWEYQICHLDNAVLIPMGTLPNQLSTLDRQQEIVVICHHGVRSQQVGWFLERVGFKDIINLVGGVAAWAQEVDHNMPTY